MTCESRDDRQETRAAGNPLIYRGAAVQDVASETIGPERALDDRIDKRPGLTGILARLERFIRGQAARNSLTSLFSEYH